MTLDLSVPLTQAPGGGRGFELDLPRAVVAYLDMKLPDDARAPRLNGKDVAEEGLTWKDHRLEGPLGVLDKLDVTWEGPPPAGVGPLRTARGRVTVRIDGDVMAADAELVLHAQGEPVAHVLGVDDAGGAAAKPLLQGLEHLRRLDHVRVS